MYKVHSRIVNPVGNQISISVIGCGGTGSLLMPIISRFAYALREQRQLDFSVNVYDPDNVDEINPCRQGFSPYEAGYNKADCYVSRLNTFWGYTWSSIPDVFKAEHDFTKIIITATDTKQSRYEIADLIKKNNKITKEAQENYTYYWIDLGNSRDTGNVLMTDFKSLRNVIDYYPDKLEDKSVPSCSIAQSLENQNILINQYMATLGGQMLWDLLNNEELDYCGFFLNTKTFKINKIKV
jgi:PRTRC genetic system ThiF family protein